MEEQRASSADETLLSEIFGIDTASGLMRTGNDLKFYIHLLIKFREKYGEAAAHIREVIVSGDLEEAKLEAHTIRGVSGNLALNAIFEAAGQLESLLRQSSEESALLAAWEPFRNAMANTLAGLQNIALPQEEQKTLPTGNPKELLGLLYRLKPEVANLTPKRCAPIIDILESSAWPKANALKISRIIQQIRAYQLAEALEEIEGEIQKLVDSHDA